MPNTEHTKSPVVLSTEIHGVTKFITGKVRDVYDLGTALLIVATDRISAFDVVLPTGIPDKGRVLTQMSLFWFGLTSHLVRNHLISSDTDTIGQTLQDAGAREVTPALLNQLRGRSLLVEKCRAFPIECVIRGHLSGSAWKEYKSIFSHGGQINLLGHPLRIGMRESERFDTPLFTPATKAASGHDMNISVQDAADIVGSKTIRELQNASEQIYAFAAEFADERGIIIADTKFEFGTLPDGKIILIDEALTPDSSRFWNRDGFRPGHAQPSYDKQYVRDYLETLDWNKGYPAPALPDDVVEKTSAKYRDAYLRLTGKGLDD